MLRGNLNFPLLMLIFMLMFVDVVNELQELCVLLELYGF